MRDITVCDVVESRAGHDKGRLYLVIGAEGQRLLLADGRIRTLARPKVKSQKHVRPTARTERAPATDKEIRTVLAAQAAQEKGDQFGER